MQRKSALRDVENHNNTLNHDIVLHYLDHDTINVRITIYNNTCLYYNKRKNSSGSVIVLQKNLKIKFGFCENRNEIDSQKVWLTISVLILNMNFSHTCGADTDQCFAKKLLLGARFLYFLELQNMQGIMLIAWQSVRI